MKENPETQNLTMKYSEPLKVFFAFLKLKVRVGCSSGFWGDTATSVPQLIHGGNIQYLVSDYLSEITMSLLAAVKNKRPELGFTPDFLESTAPHLAEIKRRGIRLVTNAGGINPGACVAMLKTLAKKSGVEFKIAEVTRLFSIQAPYEPSNLVKKILHLFPDRRFDDRL